MWVQNTMKTAAIIGTLMAVAPMAAAQYNDRSPTLLIETGPSDNPEYRRMTFVKYLSGSSVNVAYKAYNRSEFSQIRDTTPSSVVQNCTSGKASSLSDLKAYERSERSAKRAGRTPETAIFCIKNVSKWNTGNKDKYLDPIFNGMPYAKGVN